jgi:hypothetical protein
MRRVRVIVCALLLAATTVAPARVENVVRRVSAAGVLRWEPTNLDDPTSNGLAQVYGGLTLGVSREELVGLTVEMSGGSAAVYGAQRLAYYDQTVAAGSGGERGHER